MQRRAAVLGRRSREPPAWDEEQELQRCSSPGAWDAEAALPRRWDSGGTSTPCTSIGGCSRSTTGRGTRRLWSSPQTSRASARTRSGARTIAKASGAFVAIFHLPLLQMCNTWVLRKGGGGGRAMVFPHKEDLCIVKQARVLCPQNFLG